MTDDELVELISDCPTLYHMAEAGSWSSIKEHGLLSTSALLDLYAVEGAKRQEIESSRRAASVVVSKPNLPNAVIRDQLPMTDGGLIRALPATISPTQWYELLNRKVFFWLTPARLDRLLNAGTYSSAKHDVIEVDTARLIASYRDKIWLCPINSGCTKPMPHPRNAATFARISSYDYQHWRARRKKGERAVELAIDYAVPDIVHYVRRVVSMRGHEELDTIWSH